MYRPTLGLAIAFMIASAAPVLAQEPPVYTGDYNPPVVRTGHDSKIGDVAVGGHSGTRDISGQTMDATSGGYADNVTVSDIYSGR